MSALQLSLVCVLCSCFVATAKLPNIVFVLVDDWGFADVGFRNPAISSPNFDQLAKTGLVLNFHYVFNYCSPSCASFLTG
uniref:Sulfatase N-terminal domain-containing protein n=1 Tax=Amphimedon queenslandica TaxID=400682 RepID=A0A1X7VXY2_AMPQE